MISKCLRLEAGGGWRQREVPRLEARAWRLEAQAGGWRLEVGGSMLEVRGLETGGLEARVEARGSRRPEAGGWSLEAGV